MNLEDFTDWQIDQASLDALPEADRREVQSMLRELELMIAENPLWAYKPHAKQRVYHDIKTFIGAFIGGNRSGKTYGGCADDVIQLVDRDRLPPWLAKYKVFDEFYARVVVPGQAESLDALMPIFRQLIPREQLFKKEWEKAYDQRRRKLQLANGNWVDFMSHDQNVDRFASVFLHRVRFDEEPPGSKGQAIYNESLMRTTGVSNGQIRFTMTPLFGLCVDMQTQCLTKRGWVGGDEVRPDDILLTYNVERGATEWAPLEGVYRDPDYQGPMVQTGGRKRIDALFTPDHRWVTQRGLVPFSEMTTKDKVILAAPHQNLNADMFSEDVLELVGWVLSEGSVLPNENKVPIYQSLTRYPEHCARIQELLDRIGAQYHIADRTYQTNSGQGIIRRFVVTGDFSRWVRFVVDYPKRLRPEVVASLGPKGVQALLKGLLDGDGHRAANGSWHFTTVSEDLADSVAMLALLGGERVRISTFSNTDGQTVFRVHRQTTGTTAGSFKERVEVAVPPPGGIWCPSTRNGSFVARRGGKVYITGNSWSYHLLTRDGTPRNDEECRTVTVSMRENPHNPTEQIDRVLGGLSQAEKEAREHGHFVHLAGLVFPQFSRDRHVLAEEGVPRDKSGDPLWAFYDGIDPGYGHPMGYVLVAVDAYGMTRVLRSWKMAGMTVADCAKRIHETRAELKVKPKYTIIDPSARNRNHATGRSVQLEYAEEGIHSMPGQNSREAGINRVATYLERDLLVLWDGNDELVSEFETHRWKQRRGEEEGEPEVIKVNDDILDPLRYVLMSRPPLKGMADDTPVRVGADKAFEDSIKKLGRKRGRNTWGARRYVG